MWRPGRVWLVQAVSTLWLWLNVLAFFHNRTLTPKDGHVPGCAAGPVYPQELEGAAAASISPEGTHSAHGVRSEGGAGASS